MEISSSLGLKKPLKLALGMKKFPYLKLGPFPFRNPIFVEKVTIALTTVHSAFPYMCFHSYLY
jgi:hypothetical protein